jgi:hypothetical protein
MNRKQSNSYYNYNDAKCCNNCRKREDISEESGMKKGTLILCDNILLRCEENTNTRVDKSFVCNLWEAE